MRKITSAALLALVGIIGAGGSAHADPVSPAPGHVDRTWHGTRWQAPEPEPTRTWHGTPWSPSRTWAPPAGGEQWVRVQAGDTLWSLAVTYRGSGWAWPALAELNGVSGTTIYAGSLLRVR